jgi:hypothetical protein
MMESSPNMQTAPLTSKQKLNMQNMLLLQSCQHAWTANENNDKPSCVFIWKLGRE